MMQGLVDRIYKRKRFDKIKPITRYEYEQRDVRTKLDIADIYLKLEEISKSLATQNIDIQPVENKENLIVEIVDEDRRSMVLDLEEVKYKERMKAYEDGKLTERLRRLFSGDPVSPMFQVEQEEPITFKQPTQKEGRVPEDQKIDDLLSSIEKNGGVNNATAKQKEELSTVIKEMKDVLQQTETTTTNPVVV